MAHIKLRVADRIGSIFSHLQLLETKETLLGFTTLHQSIASFFEGKLSKRATLLRSVIGAIS